ncbi:MAG TPA: alpha/beta fold hydrolase [Gaiellaceae bacterium]|jgi:pimeloyl-ACP methyl ester carboxylesterase|nr:alpha/beta fold hydrolase [Gaiellaceae bacterium]
MNTFRPTRIVALAFITLTTVGLVYLHFGLRSDMVSVPSGAKAGQLKLHPCHYATENGSYRADCGTHVVRENRHDPNSRLIALPVKRIRARFANPDAPIFRLQGGPGISNMSFPDASRFADKHDVVLVGYRGVDGSSRLDCPEVTSAREQARDLLSAASYRADASAFRACARRLQDDGVDLAGYSLPERVDDLDAARRALGYEQIDLLSESAGTRTAMIYAWRYPKRIHRSVMIGVNPPGHFLWDAQTTGEQIRRYAALNPTPGLTASLHSAYRNIPGRFWFLPIKKGNVKAAAFFGLTNATTDGGGPLNGPLTIQTLRAADRGDGSGAWLLSTMGQLLFPRQQVWGDVAAVGLRTDAAAARRFFAAGADPGSVIGAPGTDLIWSGGRVLDAWPANPDENEYARVRDSNVETLLVGGQLDFATPPQWATRELLPHLPNGRQVVIRNIGHSDDFWTYQPKASTHLIDTFFDTGRVDTSLYRNKPVDFTPSMSQGSIAKIVLGSMLGFGALTVLSVLWLPLRRRPFGWKASATLRSLYALVLGLGGWFVGALIVLTALPTVPLQDELLGSLSVGVPIGLAVYFAWVIRNWSVRTKAIGFAAAAGGALVGAWLGFNVTSAGFGLLAPLLAIPGAVVGANLTVLALDIAWDLQARERFAADARETLEARLSTG